MMGAYRKIYSTSGAWNQIEQGLRTIIVYHKFITKNLFQQFPSTITVVPRNCWPLWRGKKILLHWIYTQWDVQPFVLFTGGGVLPLLPLALPVGTPSWWWWVMSMVPNTKTYHQPDGLSNNPNGVSNNYSTVFVVLAVIHALE